MNTRLIITYLILAIIAWGIFYISFTRDRSRYRNVALLGMALVLTTPFIFSILGGRAIMIAVIVFCVLLLIVPIMLISNGILMWRREGHSMANLLSFIIGIIIGVGEISTLIIVFISGTELNFTDTLANIALINLVISITVIYASVCLLLFVLYSIFLQLIPRKSDFDYVIIHGAGLIDGSKVSKLLSDRIDKAINVYETDPSPTILIPSGGKGSDESISEAEAMAEYLKEHGIPESDIIMEDKSTTTMENLENCKAIIDSREGRKYTALVTSNYHVYRALRYCRKIGLNCTGIGSHTALYYWPSAVIREFIAIHAETKHLILFFVGWALCTLPLLLLL